MRRPSRDGSRRPVPIPCTCRRPRTRSLPRTDMASADSPFHQPAPASAPGMSRRSFLRTSAVLTTGLAALATSLRPLLELDDYTNVERFMQKYYKEMTPDDMDRVLKRITNEVEKQYGVRPHVRDLR